VRRKLFTLRRKIIKRILPESKTPKTVETLYQSNDYLDAYSQHTDMRVAEDPHEAVGGFWDEIGLGQFNFLVSEGLLPEHRLLDIGCGTLRGGRHFIQYLNDTHYCGIDISSKAIEYSHQLVQQEGLSAKQPRLILSQSKDLKFNEFEGEVFDFVLAQSVFTHLMPQHIEECLANVGKIMNAKTLFFFTFNQGEAFTQTGVKDFRYPFSFFQSLADQYGFILEDRSHDYKHRRGQHMARLKKRGP